MPSISRSERLVRGTLLSSVALVSALVIGIGYSQQTSGALMQGSLTLPMEEEIMMQPENFMKVEEPSMVNDTEQPAAEEEVVWCCNADVGLCYEQPTANGCGDDKQSTLFEDCAAGCQPR
jgi:hypothetical protein